MPDILKKSTLFRPLAIAGIAALMLAACQDQSAPSSAPVSIPAPAAQASAASAPAPVATDSSASVPASWLGKWTGPEGTSLTLGASGAKYEVVIRSLDGPATYEGTGVGDHIQFMRNGPESIRAGSGKDTGMKWLLGKTNCLYIKAGEGFCRDL